MVSQKKRSLGGQLDLLVKFRRIHAFGGPQDEIWPVTSAAQRRPRWLCRPGRGYLWLMDCGDGAKDERPPYVEKCRTLIVTPKKVDWLTAMEPIPAPTPGKKPGAPIRPLPWSVDPRFPPTTQSNAMTTTPEPTGPNEATNTSKGARA